jgi:alkyl sulfatase BDS1-like metallo-beta-lactamase superfamily hydrolase
MVKANRFAFAVLSCLIATGAPLAQLRAQKPELVKVTDRIYSATGYALGNVIYVITGKSIVVIDTTESPAAARQTLAEMRKISQLPISYIIYTHFHGDHINGANVFKTEGTRIIAQREHTKEMARYVRLAPYNRRLNAIQFGATLDEKERGVSLARDPRSAPERGYLRPDILFDDKYAFEEGGVRFELYHTTGETLDHLMVWLPDEGALLPGDLFYQSFPMLASPMKHDRPVLAWAESVERMRGFKPRHLVGSHSRPLSGEQQIDQTLANYARAIRHVHDETIKLINQGKTLDEVRAAVRLPEDLARLDYLQPNYGRVEWSVNGIYRQYTGWYDFNPAHLNPAPGADFNRAMVEAAGSAAIIKRAETALSKGEHQLAAMLADVVLDGEPSNQPAHRVAAAAYEKLAGAARNTVERNIYLAAAREHKAAAGK